MIYLEKLEEAKKKKGRCWTGYKPKPGSVPYSKGSCVKEAYKLIGLALIEAKVDKGLTPEQKIKARIARSNDAPDELEQKTRKGPVGDMARSKAQRKVRVEKAKAENESPETKKAKTFAKNREREAAGKNLKASNKLYNLSDPNEKPKRKKGKS